MNQEKEEKTLKQLVKEIFSVDTRSLALFRIGLGILIVVDLISRSFDLKAFYTDEGAIPRTLSIADTQNTFFWSFHMLNGTWQVQAALFLLAGVFALMLIIGYHTRLVTIMSWIFMLSLHVRSPLILDGGDYLFRLLLFWSIFLPLGSCFSVDNVLKTSPMQPRQKFFSVACIALYLQVMYIYLFSVVLKWQNDEWSQGNATYYALSEEQYATRLGQIFLHFSPVLLKYLTNFVIYLETIGPFMLISPVYTTQLRIVAIVMFWFMHLGFGTFLDLEFLPWVDFVSLIPFLPSVCWDKFFEKTKLYAFLTVNSFNKRVCGLCNKVQEKLSSIEPLFVYRETSFYTTRFTNVVVSFFLIIALFCNIEHVSKSYKVPQPLKRVAELVHIDQWWYLFTPTEKVGVWYTMWYVIVGKLSDGTEVDLFRNGEPVGWERPKYVSELYKDRNWKKYLILIGLVFKDHLSYYSYYLCTQWNKTHLNEKRLMWLDTYVMYDTVLPDYKHTETQKIYNGRYYCPK